MKKYNMAFEVAKMWDKDFKQVSLPTISLFHNNQSKTLEITIMFFIWSFEISIWRTER